MSKSNLLHSMNNDVEKTDFFGRNRRSRGDLITKDVILTHIFPVSALRQPYTSPKPPRPIIRCTLKSFIESCRGKLAMNGYN